MHVRDFDLNALVALEALLRCRSVTKAASSIGRSQPATSHALKRLRLQLKDELLVRSGNTMVLTSRGEQLLHPVQQILRDVQGILDEGPFDPATTRRAFSLTCHDLLAPLVPDILGQMRAEAPACTLDQLLPPGPGLEQSGLVEVGPTANAEPRAIAVRLGELSWSLVAREGHPIASARISVDAWTRYPHVVVRTGLDTAGFVQAVLDSHGIARDVAYVSPSFMAVPEVLAQTDLLFVGMSELMRPLAARFDLVMLPLPVDVPAVPISMRWHSRHKNDPGHRWFRELLGRSIRAALQAG